MRAPLNLKILGPALALRHRLLRAVREFFTRNGYLEVETPVRVAVPALEPFIDAEPSGGKYLRTSPELHMKRLLVAGCERIFQIGPCFRHGERGRLHAPEYTLLEWYRVGADYRDALEETRELLRFAAARADGGAAKTGACGGRAALDAPWDKRSVSEAFQTAAGWDPVAVFDGEQFDDDLLTRVEPSFARDRPTVLMDFPAQRAALARCRPGPPRVAERWELYVDGIELANAFSELTDPVEQRERFERCRRERRAAGAPDYTLDDAFLQALDRGLPDCAGVALGVDRLTMVLAGASDIAQVRPFLDE